MFAGFPQAHWQAVDDKQRRYTAMPNAGGGGGAEFRFQTSFAPDVAGDARRLTLTCEEIDWMALGPGTRSKIEFGPWEFEVPLD